MSDELEQVLNQPIRKKPSAARLKLPTGSCVPQRQPSDAGPELEIVSPGPEVTRATDAAHTTGGPHGTSPTMGMIRPGHLNGPDLLDGLLADERTPEPSPGIVPRRVEKPASAAADHQLVAISLKKSYRKGQVEIPVLMGVTLGVRKGEFLAVVGQSGCGKSTLLHLLGTLDAPDSGEIHFDGRRIDNLPAAARDTLRNKNFGMIFQFYHLLPELSTLENVLAPLMIAHSTLSYFRHRRRLRRNATELLEMIGLGHRLSHKPRELSGGEMQRAAIARALIAGPDLLLADEPTGNLDHATGQEIMKTLTTLNERTNLTIVMVTHDQSIAQRAHRVVRLADGQIEG